jgi:ATP-dependent DNA ligase
MILDILNDIASNTSRNYKLEVAQNNSTNELFKRVVFLAYDPFTQFYIRKIPKYTPAQDNQADSLDSVLDSLTQLSSRNVTGNAGIEYLAKLLSSLNASDAEVLERIIGKDLRCGASESTFNKVWPGLIHEYPVMLCSAFDEKLVAKIKYPAFVQKKEDGMRFNAIIKNGTVEFRSRNGKEIQLLGNLEQEFLEMAQGEDLVFDGELLVINGDGSVCDRQTGNGILNKANKGTITAKDAAMVHAELWDMIPYEEFMRGVWKVAYSTRWNNLLSRSNEKLKKIHFVDTTTVLSYDEARVIFEDFLDRGYEGIILKDSMGIWENKRSKTQIKFKGENECDLRIVGVKEGTGKYEGMIGALECESECGVLKVSVGSGFNDEQRKARPEDLMNKIAALKYNMKIKNKQGEESLFLPILLEIREDKTTADYIGDIK